MYTINPERAIITFNRKDITTVQDVLGALTELLEAGTFTTESEVRQTGMLGGTVPLLALTVMNRAPEHKEPAPAPTAEEQATALQSAVETWEAKDRG